MNYYTVIGSPITHSLSPIIHQAFATQCQLSLIYTKTHISPARFTQALPQLFAKGLIGANITAPFKQQAFQLAQHHTERAQLAESVNTLLRDHEGKLKGDTTDGAGLIYDILHHHQKTITNQVIMILGAGGSTRSILTALISEKPAGVFIAHHNLTIAQQLANQFSHYFPISALSLTAIAHQPCDMLINTIPTTAWLQNCIFPPTFSLANTWCYDICYGQNAQAFIQFAQHYGATQLTDGLGMLVAQAGESFYFWHGIKPQTTEILAHTKKIVNE